MINKIIGLAGVLFLSAMIAVPAVSEDIDFSASLPEFSPVRAVEPVYPQRAMDRKITGYALVEYNIKENGKTDNVKVVDAEPSGVFDKASKRAVLRTVYDETDAMSAQGDTFYKLYVYELDTANANELASRH